MLKDYQSNEQPKDRNEPFFYSNTGSVIQYKDSSCAQANSSQSSVFLAAEAQEANMHSQDGSSYETESKTHELMDGKA